MKTLVASLFVLIVNSISILAQTHDLIPYRKGDKWGYCDKNKKIIVECKYDEAEFFFEHVGRVFLNGKYGFVDKKGKEIIPSIYDYAWSFKEGLSLIYDEETKKYFFIDKEGKEVSQKYDYVEVERDRERNWIITENFIVVGNKEYTELNFGIIDKFGNEIIPPKYYEVRNITNGFTVVRKNKKWNFSLIDLNNKVEVLTDYDYISIISKSGIGIYEKDKKYGIIKNFKIILPSKYEYIDEFKFEEGFAAVKINDKWGFIDTNGIEVIPAKYDDVSKFHNGFAAVKINDKWGVINKEGKEIIQIKYDYTSILNDNGFVVSLNDKVGILDSSGKEIVPIKYVNIRYIGYNNLIENDNGECAVMNDKFKIITPFIYTCCHYLDNYGYMGDWRLDLCEISKLNKISFVCLPNDDQYEKIIVIDENGKEILPSNQYKEKEIISIQEKYFIILDSNNKYGVIDYKGRLIIKPIYDDISYKDFNGYFLVVKDGKYCVIDFNGTEYCE